MLPFLPHSFLPPKPKSHKTPANAPQNYKSLDSFGARLLMKMQQMERDKMRNDRERRRGSRRKRRVRRDQRVSQHAAAHENDSLDAEEFAPDASELDFTDDVISHHDTNRDAESHHRQKGTSHATPRGNHLKVYISPQSNSAKKHKPQKKKTSEPPRRRNSLPAARRRESASQHTTPVTPRVTSTKTTIVRLNKPNGNDSAPSNEQNHPTSLPPAPYNARRPSTTKSRKRTISPSHKRQRRASIQESGPFYSDPAQAVLKPMSQLRQDMQSSRQILDMPPNHFKKSPVRQRDSSKNDQIYRFLFDYHNNIEPGTAGAMQGVVPKPVNYFKRNSIGAELLTPRGRVQSASSGSTRRRNSSTKRTKSVPKSSAKRSHLRPDVPPLPFTDEIAQYEDEEFVDDFTDDSVDIDFEDNDFDLGSQSISNPASTRAAPTKQHIYDNFLQHMIVGNDSKPNLHQTQLLMENSLFWKGYAQYLMDGLRREKEMGSPSAQSNRGQKPDFIQRHLQERTEEMARVNLFLHNCLSQCLQEYQKVAHQSNMSAIEALFATHLIGALQEAAQKKDSKFEYEDTLSEEIETM